MIARVLVPTDFSEGSKVALRRAEDVARDAHAQLILLHVIDDVLFVAPDGFGYIPPHIHAAQQQQIKAMLEEEVDGLRGRGCEARGLRAFGAPHLEICSAAEKEHADLIVMGTHGRRGFARFALGSVTERVARTSKAPVLVVRPVVVEES